MTASTSIRSRGVVVDGLPGDAVLAGQRRDALPRRQPLPQFVGLGGGQCGLPTFVPAGGHGDGDAFALPFQDHRAFELGDGAEHRQQQCAHCGVIAGESQRLFDEFDSDSLAGQFTDDAAEVFPSDFFAAASSVSHSRSLLILRFLATQAQSTSQL